MSQPTPTTSTDPTPRGCCAGLAPNGSADPNYQGAEADDDCDCDGCDCPVCFPGCC